MRFSRQMIELIQQVRRPAQAELGEQVLLADPQLFETLGRIVNRTQNPDTRRTIAEVFRLAGEAVPAPLASPAVAGASEAATAGPRKVYRGCVIS